MIRFANRSALALVLAAVALPGAAHAAPLAQDSAFTLGSFAKFTAVRDWEVRQEAGLTTVVAPEGDGQMLIVDVGPAADAAAAATAALARIGMPGRYPLEITTPRAPIDGWDERVALGYKVPPAQTREFSAIALRQGTHWLVVVFDGTNATFEKRGAALNTMFGSLRPASFVAENFAAKKANPLNPARIGLLQDFLRSAMAQLKVPGIGLALIENGRIVYEGGLGTKVPGQYVTVDAHTRFMIASNTKGMATLLLAQLADEGKLRWDQPVTQVYPPFRLGSDATTASVRMEHLVCACTGLPRKDIEWLLATKPDTPATDTFRQLAATEPTSKFGEVFQYNNLMASAAGYIGGYLAYPKLELGKAFDTAMEQRIFKPLGMKDTTFDFATALGGNHAEPTGLDLAGNVTLLPQTLNRQVIPARPAGGAWSSAHDMAQYVLLELGQGQMPGGKRLVSAENLLKRRARGVPVGEDSWYGMGLETRNRYGIDVVFHGGSMAGYKSNWYALPQAGVGAVVLTNSEEGSLLLDPFLRRLIEVLYDGRDEAAARITAAARSQASGLAALRAKLTPGEPAIAALNLAPRYRNADLGTLAIAPEDGVSRMRVGPYDETFAVQNNADGSASLVFTSPTLMGLDLLAGSAAGKRTLTLRDAQHVYVFTEE